MIRLGKRIYRLTPPLLHTIAHQNLIDAYHALSKHGGQASTRPFDKGNTLFSIISSLCLSKGHYSFRIVYNKNRHHWYCVAHELTLAGDIYTKSGFTQFFRNYI